MSRPSVLKCMLRYEHYLENVLGSVKLCWFREMMKSYLHYHQELDKAPQFFSSYFVLESHVLCSVNSKHLREVHSRN